MNSPCYTNVQLKNREWLHRSIFYHGLLGAINQFNSQGLRASAILNNTPPPFPLLPIDFNSSWGIPRDNAIVSFHRKLRDEKKEKKRGGGRKRRRRKRSEKNEALKNGIHGCESRFDIKKTGKFLVNDVGDADSPSSSELNYSVRSHDRRRGKILVCFPLLFSLSLSLSFFLSSLSASILHHSAS